ncbi:hypothetical protein [Acidicapsa ligni]|uniref:hypothetical protein n=1 Tax=Acidicapsa ligni TaxID=542300 RepID=UPI0021DF7657|nr:hypothetical protein [Acidicapsa ligni]
MLRRITAAIILFALAILIQPCAPAAARSIQAQHQCCAPSATLSGQDCCSNAAPNPANAPDSDQQGQQGQQFAHAIAPGIAIAPVLASNPALFTAATRTQNPPVRPPATILRT